MSPRREGRLAKSPIAIATVSALGAGSLSACACRMEGKTIFLNSASCPGGRQIWRDVDLTQKRDSTFAESSNTDARDR
jgi:hypothetical protein